MSKSIFFAGFLLFSFIAQSQNLEEQNPALDRILKKGYLIVAMIATDSPPFVMADGNGDVLGIDVDLARRIAKALGVRLHIDRTSKTYDEVVDKVADGDADIGLSGISITTKRAEKVSYTKSYIKLHSAFLLSRGAFFRKKRTNTASLKSFFDNGNSMGVQKGSSYEYYAKTIFPKAKIVLYDSESINTQAVEDLETGKIDALFQDEFQVQRLIQSRYHGVLKFMAISLVDTLDPIGIVIDREARNLLNWANIFLEVQNISYTIDDMMAIYDKQRSIIEK